MDTLKIILEELKKFFDPLVMAVQKQPPGKGLEDLFLAAGIDAPGLVGSTSLATDIGTSTQTLVDFLQLGKVPTPQEAIDTLNGFKGVLDKFEQNPVADTVENLLSYLAAQYLFWHHQKLYNSFNFVGALSRPQDEEDPRAEWVDFDYLGRLISDPANELSARYGWNTPDFHVYFILEWLAKIMNGVGFPSYLEVGEDDVLTALGITQDVDEPDFQLRVSMLSGKNDAGYWGLGVIAAPSARPIDGARGIGFVPYLKGNIGQEMDLGGDWKLKLEASFSGGHPYAMQILPAVDVTKIIEASVTPTDPAVADPSFSFATSITRDKPGNDRYQVLGSADGFLIEVGGIGMKAVVTYDNDLGVRIELPIRDGFMSLKAGKEDGFLAKILPEDGLSANFDVVLGWGLEEGLYVQGGANSNIIEIVVDLPIHKKLGPINFDQIHLGTGLDQVGWFFSGKASFSTKIGPIAASVSKIGAKVTFSFDKSGGGDLGPLNYDFTFLPPTGVGLAIDTSGLVGGGFLDFDNDNKRYAGILAMKFSKISLVAIGLITTRMPDGSKGFSMLASITAQFTPVIQLSMGFSLKGVGGLIGINRTLNTTALRAGLKSHSLDSILFPDPATVIPNANQIISDLRAIFPAEEKRFVVGPMIKLLWGTDGLVDIDLGVFINLPDPVIIALLGRISAKVPTPSKALISLNIDVLGIIDFGKKTMLILADIYDSKILVYDLSGGAGVYYDWGRGFFALSLGGFHPKYNQQPGELQGLGRLALALSSSSKFQLTCQTYMHLSSNCFGFGARANLYFKKGKVTVTGYMGFDSLFYFNPFSFEVAIAAGVSVKYKSKTLASVDLALNLSGPAKWNANGSASCKILFFKVKVRFNITWGQDRQSTIPAIDPWIPLEEALLKDESWGGALPPGKTAAVVLVDRDASGAAPVLAVHPGATLEIRPNVLPFERNLEKLGNAPVTGHNSFRIVDAFVVDGSNKIPLDVGYGNDLFARGQFENLTKDQQLSVPSFEQMPGVIEIKGTGCDCPDGAPIYELKYESILIDVEKPRFKALVFGTLSMTMMKGLIKGGAAARSGLLTKGDGKFAATGATPSAEKREEGYTIVRSGELTPANNISGNAGEMTRWEADQAVEELIRTDSENEGQYVVLNSYEVAA